MAFAAPLPKPLIAAATAPTLAATAGASGLFIYSDASGNTQIVEGIENVPLDRRALARPVASDGISLVAGDPRIRGAAERPATESSPAATSWRPAGSSPRPSSRTATAAATDRAARNEFGENYTQAAPRLAAEAAMQRRNGGQVVPNSVSVDKRGNTIACKWGGAPCSSRLDCCSGNCAKAVCQ